MTVSLKSGSSDEEDKDEDEDSEVSPGNSPTAGSKPVAVPSAPPGGQQRTRRPSVLGVFSNDGAKAAGLYALQTTRPGKTDGEVASELVEVKRSSIIMSTGMLTDILKTKVDNDRLAEIQ